MITRRHKYIESQGSYEAVLVSSVTGQNPFSLILNAYNANAPETFRIVRHARSDEHMFWRDALPGDVEILKYTGPSPLLRLSHEPTEDELDVFLDVATEHGATLLERQLVEPYRYHYFFSAIIHFIVHHAEGGYLQDSYKAGILDLIRSELQHGLYGRDNERKFALTLSPRELYTASTIPSNAQDIPQDDRVFEFFFAMCGGLVRPKEPRKDNRSRMREGHGFVNGHLMSTSDQRLLIDRIERGYDIVNGSVALWQQHPHAVVWLTHSEYPYLKELMDIAENHSVAALAECMKFVRAAGIAKPIEVSDLLKNQDLRNKLRNGSLSYGDYRRGIQGKGITQIIMDEVIDDINEIELQRMSRNSARNFGEQMKNAIAGVAPAMSRVGEACEKVRKSISELSQTVRAAKTEENNGGQQRKNAKAAFKQLKTRVRRR